VDMIDIGPSARPPGLDPCMDRHPIMSVDHIEALFPCKNACRPAIIDHFPKEIRTIFAGEFLYTVARLLICQNPP